MFVQTRLGTFGTTPNDNICFPVGMKKPGFPAVFGEYKKKGRDLNSLIMALVSYKLYLRILVLGELGEWINQGEVLIFLVSMDWIFQTKHRNFQAKRRDAIFQKE